jgi:hypothetical protein
VSLAIRSACTLCGHVYGRLDDADEMNRHMADAHDMHFVTGPFPFRPHWRKGQPMPLVSPHP